MVWLLPLEMQWIFASLPTYCETSGSEQVRDMHEFRPDIDCMFVQSTVVTERTENTTYRCAMCEGPINS